jgi:hypothetical protein
METSVSTLHVSAEAGTSPTCLAPFLDFNLEFYTEVQELSYLENALTAASPRFKELNMAICSLVEDFGLVGFETLAVEVTPPVRYLPNTIANGSHTG